MTLDILLQFCVAGVTYGVIYGVVAIGFTLIYNLNELDMPSVYSSIFAHPKSLRERPVLVQRFVAVLAEAVHFVEKNPGKTKTALSKVLNLKDQDVLQ